MRLMQPSPGEVIDRITILDLKIKHSGREEFKEEQRLLQAYFDEKKFNVPSELFNELVKINSRLWDLEDKQRQRIKEINWDSSIDETHIISFAYDAKLVIQLNDARAKTVKKINEVCGVNHVEKLHATN